MNGSGHAKQVALWAMAAMSCMVEGNRRNMAQTEARTERTVQIPTAGLSSHMSPSLPIRVIRPNNDLEIAFDVRTRNAVYVMERVHRDGHNLGKDHRRPSFYEEKGIPEEEYRSRLSHYKNSGYDRGHLAPAADFPLSTEDTYNLCNVSPQNHAMNIAIWNQVEGFVRRVADRSLKKGGDTYVVTGPLWVPNKKVDAAKYEYSYYGLGTPPALVAVPTHLYKVVITVHNDQISEFACFVVPNSEPDKNKTMVDYVVPWTDLETVAGLQFFPNWATPQWKAAADRICQDSVFKFRQATTQQPLLTDGSRSSKGGGVFSFSRGSSVQHLCKGGECK